MRTNVITITVIWAEAKDDIVLPARSPRLRRGDLRGLGQGVPSLLLKNACSQDVAASIE